jgi:hypothetical protein
VCRERGTIARVVACLADGRAEVSREVKDQLAVNDHVVVRLFEVAGEHFWK